MANEIWKLGASDLAQAIRKRELKSREVVEAFLSRIADVNPKLNAITVTLADSALAAADEADRATVRGGVLPPLHGVPITVKENVDVAGSATTQGIVAMAEAVPPVDAPHIAQLRAAGAIPFARTNLPDFGLRWHTDNALRGATKNPWDASRTPGGSSGGEAAALATGMTPLGVGNDLGGSLRWPSYCCGTAAIRATLGRVPDHSSLAPADPTAALQLMAVQGPMARHVRDLRLALSCMSAGDARDPWSTPAPLQGPAAPKRAAVCADPGGMGVDPHVSDAIRKAAAALKDAGYDVEEVDLPMVPEATATWAGILVTELVYTLQPVLQQIGSADANRFLAAVMEAIPPVGLPEYVGLFSQRNGIARAWAQFHERYPVVVGPVATIPPFAAGQDLGGAQAARTILEALRLTVTVNLLGLPAAAIPVGVANGLPQGVQIIGGRYREDLCLDAAEAIEARLGVITPIDPR
jgi:amidase